MSKAILRKPTTLCLVISKHFTFLLTVNIAQRPFKLLQGQTTMSDPTHLFVWSASSVNDGITHQKTLRNSCAVTGFSKNYTSVLLNIHLQRLFNIAYIEIYFRNEESEVKKYT